ncbi:MAG: phosphopantetheine-binding protein [Chlorobiaceae bacterium]|jgi:acyl carrier protein
MLSEKELFDKIEESIRVVLNAPEVQIKKESMFKADLDAESIDFLDISYEIEQRTGIALDFNEAMHYITEKKGADITDISVGDVFDYIIQARQQNKENA